MAPSNQPNDTNYSIHFDEMLNYVENHFPYLTVLNHQGQVSHEDMLPDLTDAQFIELYEQLLYARTLYEESMNFSNQARLGFYAPTLGQEAVQAGSMYALDTQDWVFGGYRDLPQLAMHGADVSELFLWSLGHVGGGQMRQKHDLNATVPQIVVASHLTQAVGNAIGLRKNGKSQITVTYTGEGAASQGDFYEALNFAGRYNAPILFIIQNNGFAISTPAEAQTRAKTVAQKALAAGVASIQVDGNDALAVYQVTRAAREWILSGKGPILIEAITSRMAPHSNSGDNPDLYRDEASVAYWQERDPLDRYRTFLKERNLYTDEQESTYIEGVQAQIRQALKDAEGAPTMSVDDALTWVYADEKSVDMKSEVLSSENRTSPEGTELHASEMEGGDSHG